MHANVVEKLEEPVVPHSFRFKLVISVFFRALNITEGLLYL